MINGLGLEKIQRNFRLRNFHREDPRLCQLGLGSTSGHRPIWAESGHYRNQMSTSGDSPKSLSRSAIMPMVVTPVLNLHFSAVIQLPFLLLKLSILVKKWNLHSEFMKSTCPKYPKIQLNFYEFLTGHQLVLQLRMGLKHCSMQLSFHLHEVNWEKPGPKSGRFHGHDPRVHGMVYHWVNTTKVG